MEQIELRNREEKIKDGDDNSANVVSHRISQEKPTSTTTQNSRFVSETSQPVAPSSSAFTPTSTPTPTRTPAPESSSDVPVLATSETLSSGHGHTANNNTITKGTLDTAHAELSSAPPSPTFSQQPVANVPEPLPTNNTDHQPETLDPMPNGQVKSS